MSGEFVAVDNGQPIVVWAVAWRPIKGGSWDILRDDDRPVIYGDRAFAQRRALVQAEKFPDHLYQALPMEGHPVSTGSERET